MQWAILVGMVQIVGILKILYDSAARTASNPIGIVHVIADITMCIQTAKTRDIG
jgi:hypothetical protein